MNRKLTVILVTGFLALALAAVCGVLYLQLTDISRAYAGPQSSLGRRPDPKEKTCFIGVVSRFSPATTYEIYQPLIDHLNRTTSYHFELRLSRSYEETVQQLAFREVTAAFLGSYIFAQARHDLPIAPLLRPLNPEGRPLTRSAVITREDGPVKTVLDLRSRALALPSPASFSGNWLTRMALRDHGLAVQDLKEIRYFDHHHTVVFQVLWGRFDVGVVRESVAREYLEEGIRILAFSPSFSGAPLVVHKEADPKLAEELKRSLMEITNRFVEARDEDYNALDAWIDQMDEEHG